MRSLVIAATETAVKPLVNNEALELVWAVTDTEHVSRGKLQFNIYHIIPRERRGHQAP